MNATNESMVVLKLYDNTTQALIAKSMLDSAGIFSVLNDEYMSTLYTTAAFPIRLMVREVDAQEAMTLLEGR